MMLPAASRPPRAGSLLLVSLTLGWFSPGIAGASAATYAFPSLVQPATAIQTALGGLQTCPDGGPEGMRANPAALAGSVDWGVAAGHQEWLSGLKSEWVGATLPVKGGALGLEFAAVHAGDLPAFSDEGLDLGSFRPAEVLAGLAYAHPVGRVVRIGVAGHALYLNGPEADLQGAAFHGGAELLLGSTRIGLALLNLGPGPRSDGPTYRLPTQIAAGVRREAVLGSELSLSASLSPEGQCQVAGGLLVPLPGGAAAMTGARFDLDASGEAWTPRIGLSLPVRALSIAYAYVPGGEVGATHHMSIQFHSNALN